jgi:hypothetical protein
MSLPISLSTGLVVSSAAENVQGRGPSMAVGVVAVLARIRSLTSRVVVVVSIRRSGDRHGTWDGIIDVCNRQNHFVSEGTLRGLGE